VARISLEPAVTCERAGCRFGRGGGDHSNIHRIPAPRLMAIDARSTSAKVKRARFAFTVTPSLSVFAPGPATGLSCVEVDPRSLALRLHLAMDLPWTAIERRAIQPTL
jgi:hypothetical protein